MISAARSQTIAHSCQVQGGTIYPYAAAVFVAAISNFLLARRLLGDPAQLMLALNAFQDTWALALVLFGVHLGLVGYLAYVSGYVPRMLGVLLLIASAGYLIANLGKILIPPYGGTLDVIVAAPAALGELAFAVWLLVRAARLAEGIAGSSPLSKPPAHTCIKLTRRSRKNRVSRAPKVRLTSDTNSSVRLIPNVILSGTMNSACLSS